VTINTRVTANATAEVGSIGTVAVVWDTSKAAEDAGIEVHVVCTAPLKGAFVDGAPITDEALEDLQRRVDDLNGHFLRALTRGRGLRGQSLARVNDGRIYGAAQAKRLGLIDEVQGRDEAFGAAERAGLGVGGEAGAAAGQAAGGDG
jgi:protease-4